MSDVAIVWLLIIDQIIVCSNRRFSHKKYREKSYRKSLEILDFYDQFFYKNIKF